MDDADDGYQRVNLRIPRALHARLAADAAAKSRSMNAQIIALLSGEPASLAAHRAERGVPRAFAMTLAQLVLWAHDIVAPLRDQLPAHQAARLDVMRETAELWISYARGGDPPA